MAMNKLKTFYRVTTSAGEAPRCEAVEFTLDEKWGFWRSVAPACERLAAPGWRNSPAAAWDLALEQAREEVRRLERAAQKAREHCAELEYAVAKEQHDGED